MRASDGPKTIQELIARGKASRAKLNYGAGITITRLAGYDLRQGRRHRGAAHPLQGQRRGGAGPAHRQRRFHRRRHRAEPAADPAAASSARSPSSTTGALPTLPDVKPLSEAAGLPQIDEMSSWIGLVAPAGTPPAIVEKIHATWSRVYADAAVADRLEKAGILAVTTTPEEFDTFFRDEAARWTKVYKESGDQARLIAREAEERHERDARHRARTPRAHRRSRARAIGLIIPSVNTYSEPQFNHFAPEGLGIHVARARVAGEWKRPLPEMKDEIATAAQASVRLPIPT